MDDSTFFLSSLPENSYGIIASRRVGSAVIRNLIRRRLKEAICSVEKMFPCLLGIRMVIVAKKGILKISFEEISQEIYNVVKNLKKEKPGDSCFNG